jgi:hypothetical protein
MTETKVPHANLRAPSRRWAHRRTCILAGGLVVLGGILALLVHPWFAAAAIVGGIWLLFEPDSMA